MSRTEADYRAMFARIEALQTRADIAALDAGRLTYLVDEAIDSENVELPCNHPDYWDAMFRALCMAAGMRAEEYGFSINDALGEVIY